MSVIKEYYKVYVLVTGVKKRCRKESTEKIFISKEVPKEFNVEQKTELISLAKAEAQKRMKTIEKIYLSFQFHVYDSCIKRETHMQFDKRHKTIAI